MKLSAPTQAVWYIAVILGILGIISALTIIPGLSGSAFWLVAIGWVLLVIGTATKGL